MKDELISSQTPPVLDYSTPSSSRVPLPQRFWLAILLAAPGSICWMGYLFAINGVSGPSDLFLGAAALLWLPAIFCAVISLNLFVRFRPTAYPWYVILNLVVNTSGLAFTVHAYFFGM
jgi:hypothetical protein